MGKSTPTQQDYSYLIAERAGNAPDVVFHDFSQLQGRIFTVGDIHGATAFSDLVKYKNINDKIVLVGDLMDRGYDTYKNLTTIIENPNHFLAVRGNHEEMFMKYIRARRKNHNNESLTGNEEGDIRCFIRNGGDWAEKEALKDLESIEAYIDKLPYILKITPPGDSAFLVCHADMSFLSDDKLQDKMTLFFPTKEILTWAREKGSEVAFSSYTKVRTKGSRPVYCGHNITLNPGEETVREDTNHVNLDFGAYQGVPLVGVEHPNKAMVFGNFTPPKNKTKHPFEKIFFKQLVSLHKRMGAIEFTSTKTRDAYYRSTVLKDIDLKDVDLTDADLTGADLTTSAWREANLKGAELTGAYIHDLTEQQLKEAKWEYLQFYSPSHNNLDPDIVYLSRETFDPWSGTLAEFIDAENNNKQSFQFKFKQSLRKSEAYQHADKIEKTRLLITASRIIATHEQNPSNNDDEIIKTASIRVWMLQQFNSKPVLIFFA